MLLCLQDLTDVLVHFYFVLLLKIDHLISPNSELCQTYILGIQDGRQNGQLTNKMAAKVANNMQKFYCVCKT